MKLRQALPGDIGELTDFYTVTNEVINKRNNHFNPGNEVWPTEKMITDAVRNNQQVVGIEDGKIVLAVMVNGECDASYNSVKWNVETEKDEFWVIHALRVLPEYEGRGYAKQVLSYLIDAAPSHGIKSIRLDVLDGYGVEKLYRGFDFKYVDTVEIFYEDIGRPEKFRLLERII